MSIELIHGDCMDYMKTLPDKAFELAIVDPPYGLGMNNGNGQIVKKKFKPQRKKWDSNGRPSKHYWQELFRVSQNQIVWGGNYFTNHLPVRMGWVVWFKTSRCVGRRFSEFELAWTSFDRAARVFEQKPFLRGNTRIHPTQKPVELYKWLLHKYATKGDRILDTHLGRGSSAIACHDLKHDFVGIELDIDYYTAATKRLANHQSQLPLL